MKATDIKNYIAGNINWTRSKIFNNLDSEFKNVVEERLIICSTCDIFNGERCSKNKSALDIEGNEVVGCNCKHPKIAYAEDKYCPRGLWENGLKENQN